MTFPLACTIVANNYLAYARAFTHSFLDRNPRGKVSVLVVDRPQPGHDYGSEPFAVTFAAELGIPQFPHFAFRYSILELSTAVKPYFLLHLHRTLGCDRLCYFDPDILVFGDLSDLYQRLDDVDAVLTPHLTSPIEDSLVPAEREILLAGIYNLGFLGISFNERTLPFLDWWARRLYRECLHDVQHGLFVDQRWMDFAPAFLTRVEVLRDPGYNMAYWNLTHRRLSRRDGVWWVGQVPLRFFHFSGYDYRRPELISRFQNRFSFTDRPDVEPLFRLYAERLRREGQEVVQHLAYQLGRFDNGVEVPEVARRALRQVDPEGKRWPDPFSAAARDSFFEWLRRPADDSAEPPLPRLALLLWDQREDLQLAFTRPWREDRVRFAHWFASRGGAPEHIDPAFTADLDRYLRAAGILAESLAQKGRMLQGVVSLLKPTSQPMSLAAEEIDWLTADAGHEPRRRPRVPRLAMEMHRQRSDLLRAFPDPLGADREPLALWYATFGRLEYQLPDAVVRPVLRTLPWRKQAWARLWWRRQMARARAASPLAEDAASTPAAPPRRRVASPPSDAEGINVIGWAAAPTGVGEACRGTLAALAHAGIAGALWTLDGRDDGGQGLPFEVSLYHVNADMMEAVQRRVPRGLTAGRHRIGYWFWELAHFPLSFGAAFRQVDEVWAPSRFCQDAYLPTSPLEVRWIPPCVVPRAAAPADRAAFGVDPEAFLFLFHFDVLSVPERKNPAGLLAAFARVARESSRPVHLLLKVNHAEAEPAYVEALRRCSRGLPVNLLTDTLSREDLDRLTAACDAYVSLHRAEGLGLPLIEAMYRRKPVIATGYGGVTDFLDEETGYVVRHRLTVLETPQGPYPAGAVWAEPDLEHAAALMLALAGEPATAARKVEAARRRVSSLYSPAAAGERIRRELARIREARGACCHA